MNPMNPLDWGTLALTTVLIAAALVAEHYLTERGLGVPRQVNYAIGLVTVLAGILLWAAIRQVTVTWVVAGAMLASACASGIPDFLILYREDQQRREDELRRQGQWQQLAREHGTLARELALMRLVGDSLRYSKAHDLAESLAFIYGDMRRDIADLQTVAGQLEPLLKDLMPDDK